MRLCIRDNGTINGGVQGSGFRVQKSYRCRRDGFSLLEIILALAILTGAIAVLGEAARLGMENARIARDLTQAQLLCESKLAEIVAGVTPAEPIQEAAFEPQIDSNLETATDAIETAWLYSIDVYSIDDQGLTEVRVTVTQNLPSEKRPIEFSLLRLIIESDVEAWEETDTEGSQTGDEL